MLFISMILLFLAFLIQDTTLVEPEPSPSPGWKAYLIGYVASNLMPLVTSWITQKYINVRDTWYAEQSDLVKRLVYVGATALAMLAVQLLGVGWDDTVDGPTVISKIALATMSTLLVKIGVQTEQARSTRVRRAKRSK